MHENPSADKFGPPERSEPAIERWGGSRVVRGVLVFGFIWFSHWLRTVNGRGLAQALAAIGILVAGGLHFWLASKHASRHSGDEPYTPPTHITR